MRRGPAAAAANATPPPQHAPGRENETQQAGGPAGASCADARPLRGPQRAATKPLSPPRQICFFCPPLGRLRPSGQKKQTDVALLARRGEKGGPRPCWARRAGGKGASPPKRALQGGTLYRCGKKRPRGSARPCTLPCALYRLPINRRRRGLRTIHSIVCSWHASADVCAPVSPFARHQRYR